MQTERMLVDALTDSTIYRDYERAFTEATGLPVSLRPVQSWQLPHHGRRGENPFCAMMAGKSRSCAACLEVQQKLSEAARHEAQSQACHFGLCDTAVPVKLGGKVVAFLHTGQVFRRKPTATQFQRVLELAAEWGIDVDVEKLKSAYFDTRVLSIREHGAMVKLLQIFAQHLAMVSNQIVVQQENAEPPIIARAKEFIRQNQTEHLSLGQVARAVNTSTFYFCKMFKKYTGINFTDYVSRSRIESAKSLLLNQNLRVSEIAYQVGFQSLTHFNRVFKKVIGQSPTEYRAQLAHL